MTKVKLTKTEVQLMLLQLTVWKEGAKKKDRKLFKNVLKKLKK